MPLFRAGDHRDHASRARLDARRAAILAMARGRHMPRRYTSYWRWGGGHRRFAEVSRVSSPTCRRKPTSWQPTWAWNMARPRGAGMAPSRPERSDPRLSAEVRSARAQVQNLQEEVYATRQHFCERQQLAKQAGGGNAANCDVNEVTSMMHQHRKSSKASRFRGRYSSAACLLQSALGPGTAQCLADDGGTVGLCLT